MLLSLMYNPGAKRLQGFLLKATNLQKQDIVGLAGTLYHVSMLLLCHVYMCVSTNYVFVIPCTCTIYCSYIIIYYVFDSQYNYGCITLRGKI